MLRSATFASLSLLCSLTSAKLELTALNGSSTIEMGSEDNLVTLAADEHGDFTVSAKDVEALRVRNGGAVSVGGVADLEQALENLGRRLGSLEPNVTTALADIRAAVAALPQSCPAGSPAPASPRFVSSGQASGNPSSGKVWVAHGRAYAMAFTSVNTGSGWESTRPSSSAYTHTMQWQYTLEYPS